MSRAITPEEYAEAERQLREEAERRLREEESPEQKKARMQLITEADQSRLQQERQAEFDALPFSHRALIGAGKAAVDTREALGNLIGMDKYDDQYLADKAKRDEMLMSDAGGMTGYVGGKIAELALPTGWVAQGLTKGAAMLPNAARAVKGGDSLVRGLKSVADLARQTKYVRNIAPGVARAAPVVGAEAIVSGLDTAGGLDDRLRGAGYGVVGAGAGEAIGTGARHLVTNPSKLNPFRAKPSKDAETLMDQGVDVPPWQQAEGGFMRYMTDRLRGFGGTRTVLEDSEDAARRQWNQTLVDAARPPTPIKNDAGQVIRWENTTGPVSTRGPLDVAEQGEEVIAQLSDEFNEAYGAVYKGKKIKVDDDLTKDLKWLDDRLEESPAVAADARAKIQSVLDRFHKGAEDAPIMSPIVDVKARPMVSGVVRGRPVSGEGLKEAITEVSRMLKDGVDSIETATNLKRLRGILEDFRDRGLVDVGAGKDTFRELQTAYRNYLPLREAFNRPRAMADRMVSPAQMSAALKKNEGRNYVLKDHPLHDSTLSAQRVLGDTIPRTGPGTAEKMMLPMMLAQGGLGAAGLMGGIDAGTALLLMGGLSKPGRQALTGNTAIQRALRRGPRVVEPTLRAGGRAYGTARAQEENQ